jgi:ACS family D-galactonate transporter-like MFS transporter
MSQPTGGFDTPSPLVPARPTWVRWRILGVLLAFSFLSWFNRVSMSVAYDEQIQTQLGISKIDIGYVYSALLFTYMLCMTPGGWFADRWGARRALAVMGLGSALFVALTGVIGLAALSLSATVGALLAVRAALGVFTAPIYPASGLAIAHWFPARQRAWANGAVMGAALLGIASCYHVFGALIDGFGWPAAFLLVGAATALLAGLWIWLARDQPDQHPRVNPEEIRAIRGGGLAEPLRDAPGETTVAGPEGGDGDRWRALLTNRSLMLLTLSYAAVGYFEYLFYFWMHFYFEDELKVGKVESRNYATILSLAMAAGMVGGGWLADALTRVWGRRVGRTAVVVAGMLGGAALLGVGLLATEPAWIALWFALAMAAVGATEGPMWATALELGGRHRATAAGIFNTGGNAGGMLAPEVTPQVSSAFGWQWAIGLGSLVCLAGVCLWWWIDPEQHRKKSE